MWRALTAHVKEELCKKRDILFLQEILFLKNSRLRLSIKLFSYTIMLIQTEKKTGVLIAMKDSLTFQLKSSIIDDGRYVILVCLFNNVLYSLVNLYVPNVKQISFLKHILKKMETCRQGLLIIGGYFNLVTDPLLDTLSSRRKQSTCLHYFFHTQGLFDGWQCYRAAERNYTFYSPSCYSY